MSTLKQYQAPVIGNQLYQLLPRRYRTNDHSPLLCEGESQRLKFTQRFFRVFGDTYDSIRNRYGELLNWFNSYKAPAEVLEYLAANYGWPLDTSLDEDFQRILISNLHLVYSMAGTERGLRMVLYAHLGINCRIIRPNGPDCARACYSTVLTADSTQTYLDVVDAGIIQSDDILTVTDGRYRARCTVTSVFSNRIYIDGLSHTIRKGGRAILGSANPDGFATIGGRYLFKSDSCLTDLTARTGSIGMKSISDADRTLRMTVVFQWPFTLSSSKQALAEYLIDYMLPSRDHYIFTYFTEMVEPRLKSAISDFSRSDTRDRAA